MSSCSRTCISTMPAACWRRGRKAQAPRLLFPNATYVVGREHWERAMQPHPRDRASFIAELPGLLEATGRLEMVDGAHSKTLGNAVRFHYSDGHTPGLMLAEIVGPEMVNGETHGGVVFCADLIPGRPWVHVPITMGYDRNAELLIDEKKHFLEDKLARNVHLFFTHDPGCALAQVVRDEKGKFGTAHEVAELHAQGAGGVKRCWLAAAVLLLGSGMRDRVRAAQSEPDGFSRTGRRWSIANSASSTRQFGLDRRVEMYQWRANDGGYERVWHGAPIDSDGFAAGHENPPKLPLREPALVGRKADPGRQAARSGVLRTLGEWRVLRPNFSRLPANLAAVVPAGRRGPGQRGESARTADRRSARELARTGAAAAGGQDRVARRRVAAGRRSVPPALPIPRTFPRHRNRVKRAARSGRSSAGGLVLIIAMVVGASPPGARKAHA